MSYQTILYENRDAVLTMTLNRPDRLNAYTDIMCNELLDAFLPAVAPRSTARRGMAPWAPSTPPTRVRATAADG